MNEPRDSQSIVIYIIRHGESDGNAKGILQGQKNYSLTENGIKQGYNISEELKNINFTIIYSSDLTRAKQTADVIASRHNINVVTTPLLRERSYGHLDGLAKTPEINSLFDIWNQLDKDSWMSYRINPAAETGTDISKRTNRLIENVTKQHNGECVLFVSHSDVIRNLLVSLDWATHHELRGKTIDHAAYAKLEIKDGHIFIIETKGIVKNTGTEYKL